MFLFGHTVDLKILQSDWHFGPYLRNQISHKIWDLCKNITNKSPDLPHSTSYSFVTQCQNLEKINAPLPRKRPNKQAGMCKDGQTDPIL